MPIFDRLHHRDDDELNPVERDPDPVQHDGTIRGRRRVEPGGEVGADELPESVELVGVEPSAAPPEEASEPWDLDREPTGAVAARLQAYRDQFPAEDQEVPF